MKKIMLSWALFGAIILNAEDLPSVEEIKNNINNYSKETQIKVVKQDGYAIQYIQNPDKDVQIAAVRNNGFALRNIKNADKDVQLAAVKQAGDAIQYIQNPDKNVQLQAITTNANAISYIRNPDKDVQIAAVQRYGSSMYYIKNPDKDVQLAAVQNDGNAIRYIRNPDKDIQIAAVQQNISSIQYIGFPDIEAKLLVNGIDRGPNDFKISDKNIILELLNGHDLKVSNTTDDFIKVIAISEYFGNNIYSIEPFNVSPQATLTKSLMRQSNIKIHSLDDMIPYGFAIQYSLPNSTKAYTLYKTFKYKISDFK